jgi:CubicO group peptidase (beta-lactamase class C family)
MPPYVSSVGVLAVFVFLALEMSTVAELDPPVAVPVDDYIEAELKGQNVPGLSLAVVKDGEVVKARGYGVANLELSVAATPDSVYEIASLTKQFTATAVVMLANEKKLALDDRVCRFVTEIPEPWRAVTVRHLLTHTSGIPSHTEMATSPVEKAVGKGYTRSELIAHVAREPVKFRPGEGWSYNDFGYYLA